MSFHRAAACLLLLLMPALSSGQTWRSGTFVLQEENDSFAVRDPTDQGYTNGTRLMWMWSPAASSRSNRLIDRLCAGADRLDCERVVTVGLGQSMYTPENLRSSVRIRGDRPYGGWLYGLLMLDALKDETADHVELYAGVIGRDAHAEEAQTFVHQEITPSAPDPLGWDTQIGDRLGLLVTYERRVKHLELKDSKDQAWFDVTPTLGGAIGNVFDFVSAGATVRVGYNLPSRFLRPIPSVAIASVAPTVPSAPAHWDAYFFATAEARYMFRNIFLDAENEVYAIQREPLVRDRRIGASVRLWWLRMEYAHAFRSPEFKPNSRSHSFGTFLLTVGKQP